MAEMPGTSAFKAVLPGSLPLAAMVEHASEGYQPAKRVRLEGLESNKTKPPQNAGLKSTFGLALGPIGLRNKESGPALEKGDLAQLLPGRGGSDTDIKVHSSFEASLELKTEAEQGGKVPSLGIVSTGLAKEGAGGDAVVKPNPGAQHNERRLKRGFFEIDEFPFQKGETSGRCRVLKGKDETGTSALPQGETGDLENEALAILKVEHLLANQTPGVLNQDKQSASKWGLDVISGEGFVNQRVGPLKEDGIKLVSSQYRGVVMQPHGKWGAQIYDKHTRIWLGTYNTEEEAAKAHDRVAVKMKGDEAVTNFQPSMIGDLESAFIAGVSRDQLVEMLRTHTFKEELANSAPTGLLAPQTLQFQLEVPPAQKRQFMFEKVLTPSDVGKLNRLVFPKHYAERFFPLDLEQASIGQTLQFQDEGGKLWRFRYSYWNSSQSYVLTKGWSRYVKEKALLPGDIIVFEKGHSGQLCIGYTRAHAAAEAGLSLTPSNAFVNGNPSSSGFEALSRPATPLWNSGPGRPQLGAAPAPPANTTRLFGVDLTSPPETPDEHALRRPFRTGSNLVEFSTSLSRPPPPLTPVRQVLSEGETRFGELGPSFGGGQGPQNEPPQGPQNAHPWGEALRNGFGERREVGQVRGEPLDLRMAPREEPAGTSGDEDIKMDGTTLGLRVGPPDGEEEPKAQVKCFVDESPYGVVVDLGQYKSTQELKSALLSATKGQLIIYQDRDGDMILLGEEDWSFFRRTLSRIFIRKSC